MVVEAGSSGGAGDKNEDKDRALLLLHGNKHWSSEDDGDNADDEECVVEAESVPESEPEVEQEDSDNVDGSASIKKPLHARASGTWRTSLEIGSGGSYSVADEKAASSS